MIVRVVKLGIFCLLLLGVVPVQAKYPRPLFDKPIKLDDSGRPFVNSWQKQEDQRQLRTKNRQPGTVKKVGGPPPGSGPGQTPPTPTSAASNRPEVQQTGQTPVTEPSPEKQDFNF